MYGSLNYGYDYGYSHGCGGTLTLTAQSPSQQFTEPVTVAEAKSYMLIPLRSPVDPEEDDTILGLISTAREIAEIEQGRDLVRKQWDLALDYFPGWDVQLRAPLVSVDLVSYRNSDGTTTNLAGTTDYLVDANRQPGIITPLYNAFWPTFTPAPSSSVLVRFTSGYSPTDSFWKDSGRRIKLAMKMLVSEWYSNRLPIDKESAYAKLLFSYGRLERPR